MLTSSSVSVRWRALAVASCLGLLAAACGDDDDNASSSETTTTDAGTPAEGEGTSADVDEYCAAVEELDSGDGPPTEEQLLELKELRPDEIGEETDAVVDAFVAAEGDIGAIFSDPDLVEKFEAMEEHDAEVCGIEVSEEDEPDTEAAEGAEIIPVTAVDFEFQGIPSEIAAGPVAFEFTNEGDAAHEMAIFKLGEGVVLDDLLASEDEATDEEAQEAGGTFAPPGEGGVFANTDLEPGDYAVVCFIPGPDGKAHYELGMKTTFVVS